MLPSLNASVEGRIPPPQDSNRFRLHAPLLRLLEEGRAAMETLQVCEVPLPAPRREEQDHLREDPLLGKGQEIRDSWDPVKQKLLELDELKQARELGEFTIPYALDRWLASVKADSDSGNEHTHSKYQTAAKHIGAWAHSNHLIRLSQVTPDALDHWKSS